MDEVNDGLAKRWSPQQIAARLKLEHPGEVQRQVSHEALYQALFCQARGQLRVELTGELRRKATRRVGLGERRRLIAARSRAIPDMVMITERPAEADDRAVPGHWEGDLIMGAGNASVIITLVERTSRFVILQRVPYDHNALRVSALLSRAMGRLPSLLRRSLAWDQGREMTEPGERIPQAKDLAAVLGVNTNTVLRALRILSDEGLLEMGRGRAIVVAGTPERGVIVTKMKELIDLGRRSGYRKEELVEMLQTLRG